MLAEQTNQTYTVNILSQNKTKMLTDKYNDEDGLHKIHHCSWYKSWTKLHTSWRYNPESTKLTFKGRVITDEGQRKHSTY
jgi:hypothetical protein